MALYAISDLHLALSTDKPMDIFGGHWTNHDKKIKENWIDKVREEDTVLIAGDISWSMKQDDSKVDLDWINELPGKKIISKGNHDYWWTTVSKLNKMYENTRFLQNNYYTYNDYAICGTRGWIDPSSDKFSAKDRKIYARELLRIKLSLDAAKKDGFNKIIAMIHYPPFSEEGRESEFMKIFKEYNVEKVIYGHLHGAGTITAIEGNIEGVEYIMTSCDFINFNPVKIL